jgi:signal transduction histidine kinase
LLRQHGKKRLFDAAAKPAFAIAIFFGVLTLPTRAAAQSLASGGFGAEEIIILAALAGTVSFAVMSAIALIRSRNRTEAENTRLLEEAANLRAAADRAESLLNADDQRLVVWEAPGASPIIVGDLPKTAGAPANRGDFIAFGSWLDADSAILLDRAIDSLRDRGEGFSLALTTRLGTNLDADGRTAGGRAVVRFRDLTGDALRLAKLEAAHRARTAELEAIKAALDGAHLPSWIRDREGQLVWVNRAYCEAVEAEDRDTAIKDGIELIDQAGRDAAARVHRTEPAFHQRLSVVSAGTRLLFDVTDVVTATGSAGIAVDATEIEASEAALKRITDFQARTLDQLATAVAVFGPDRRLRSYNAAYRALFGLDAALLDAMPEEGVILDQLRATRKLPEQADFRSWKNELLSAYQAVEAREYMWHLPEGLTLRVIANPHPQGGVTWIYENVTERLDLESRYNALIRVQGETLDHLREGVAVFGSDGRLRLHNPAFATIWDLDEARLEPQTHIADIAASCRPTLGDTKEWDRLSASIAGVDESRATVSGRMERRDGRIIDYATVPLPEGQTMVTFVDITDSVQVERALLDRNEALEAANRLKNDFIQHVSYELRSPLTNIIGFTQLIADANIGPLNEKQREYVGYIMTSGQSLLTIVNDILDLATIDAGIMELDLTEVDLTGAIDAAVEGLRDRLDERDIKLDKRISAEIGTMVADEKRLRQILYNLLSNAIGFSSQGGHVSVSARRENGNIVIVVEDEGVGIPDDFIGLVFDRFESRPGGAARGGVGLGLAIVKSFVELHGGTVSITSRQDKGTTVRVTLPAQPQPIVIAAE